MLPGQRGRAASGRASGNPQNLLQRLSEEPLRKGFIAELYAPKDERRVERGERVFYAPRNARFIAAARQYIEEADPALRRFFIGPLLSEASVRANTAGVFKGFYKDRHTGIGRFGGAGGNALISDLEEMDLAYIDPPCNQCLYGSNCFMPNLILSYNRPENASPVSGIPRDWNRSAYNKKREAARGYAFHPGQGGKGGNL